MSSITREKLMAAVLVAAAVVGIALAGSGYWALWQSRNSAEEQFMPAPLIAFPERKPLAEFILVDDEKGVFDLKSLDTTETIKGKRFYVLPDGKKYPSITTVLSERGNEGITRWRESVGEQAANTIMRSAAKRGTAVHTLTEDYLNNRELSKQDVLPTALFSILKTELDNINNIVLQEGTLCSHKWGVAGRVDCIAEFNGKLSVIDFKTSTKEKKEEWVENYFIQTSAYCEMYEELYGQPIDQIVILIVTEEGATQTFVKNKKDYLPLLKPAIEEFHRKFKNEK